MTRIGIALEVNTWPLLVKFIGNTVVPMALQTDAYLLFKKFW